MLAPDALQAHVLLEAARTAAQREVGLGHASDAEAREDLVRPDAYGHDCHVLSRAGPALRRAGARYPGASRSGQSGPSTYRACLLHRPRWPRPRRRNASIVELCRQFYGMGWCTGTGGGISIREGGRIYMAPSGVQKERIAEDDIFVLDRAAAR